MGTAIQDTILKVKSTIYGHGRGWSFTSNDFLPLGKDAAVRQALSRLTKSGLIRRVAWGVYDYPRRHNTLGVLPPDIDQIVRAIARKDRIEVIASGAHAANLLGLSDQVPAKAVYLTQGPSRRFKVGKTDVVFKRTTPKIMATAGDRGALVIQALKYLGKDHVDQDVVEKLKKKLTKKDKDLLMKHGNLVPRWMHKSIVEVTGHLRHG
jgi:hypothetical protein